MKFKDEISKLDELSFNVTQNGHTEKPYNNKYDSHFEKGIYVDIVSGEVLFSSKDKFNSGCGWPAFKKPINETNIVYKEDNSYNMKRMEVKSKDSDSHLGHVFNEQNGLRYCINSAALRFIRVDKMENEGYGKYIKLFSEIE